MAFTFDSNNYLLVDVAAGGGGGSNAAAGPTGSAVPTSADYIGFNVGGNLVGVSAGNPLPVTGSISATNPSVGTTGVAAPTSATEIGIISGGNLVGVSTSNPIPVSQQGTVTISGSVSVSNFPATQVITGNLTNNNAAPGATNIGVLSAIANAAAPTYIEGDQVLLSVDLSGSARTNNAEWGGTALSPAVSTSTTGTDTAPISRSLPRKYGSIVSTTPLGASATFTGAWVDTNQTGDMYAEAMVRTDQNGANPALFIDGTDDTANSNFNVLAIAAVQVFANTTAQIVSIALTRRYWRVRYVNGTTPQTSFELTATSYPQFPFLTTSSSVSASSQAVVVQNNFQNIGSPSDAVTNASFCFPVGISQSSSFGIISQQIIPLIYNGTSWDRTRSAGIGNNVATTGIAASGAYGQFNSSLPTITSGNMTALQTDSSGRLLVVNIPATGSTENENLIQWAGTTLGVPTNFGTTPGAVVAGSVNASIFAGTTGITATGSSVNVNVTNTVPVTLASTTITGTVAVTQSTSPWVNNITQWNSVALGSPSAYGTAPGAVNVIGVNANVTNTVAISGNVGITGTVGVTQSTSPWVVSLASTTITGTVAENLTQVAGTSLGATAVTNFGTAPAAAAVPGVNASLFAGTTGITATGSSLNVNVSNTVPVTLTSTTITGTVAVTQSTSPWVDNVTQWASTSLGTPQTFGTAPTGVVIGTSSDMYIAGTRARSNQTTTAAGVQDVNIVGAVGVTLSVTNPLFSSITDGTTKAGVIAATTALKTDLSSVAGTATVTAAAGVQRVGIAGSANATLDSTIGAATAPTNAVATSAVFNSTVPALTTGQAVAAQCDTTGSQYVNTEGRKQTYRVAAVAFAPLASSTNPSFSITGSATKTIKIQKIRFSATAATGAVADIILRRYSALSGGTAASQSANIAKMDTNNAAATAVVNTWSVLATTATSAGICNSERYEIVTAAVAVQPELIEWNFSQLPNAQALTLRGTSDFIGLCASAIGTTPVSDIWIEWTEE